MNQPQNDNHTAAHEQAITLARESAFAHSHQHDYLPQTREEANHWQPHEWVITAIQAAELPSTPAALGIAITPRPMGTAPRDGTMVRLLVQFDDHATEDTEGPAWTIGACNDDNVGDDEHVGWQFAGWCWDHDHFTEGKGTPVGWLPLLDASPKGGSDAVFVQVADLKALLNPSEQRDAGAWDRVNAIVQATSAEVGS